MITIIDYGLGNLFSVKNALDHLGISATISSKEKDIKNAHGLILPGVGAFADGMKNLRKGSLLEMLNHEVLVKKKKILGLCLGMQLMVERGYEDYEHEGLGWIRGVTKRLNPRNKKYKIPHVGWNDVEIKKKNPLLVGFTQSPVFYFVHSYHVIPKDKKIVTGICDHGGTFVATLQSGNIFGAQFHPEKSQIDGLKILKNFKKTLQPRLP